MFDNLEFTVVGVERTHFSTSYTVLGLISLLYYSNLITPENAYCILDFLATAEPKKEYDAGTFKIIALPY